MTRTVPARVLLVLAVGVAGSLLAIQGWESRVTDEDAIRSLDAARGFVERRDLPDHGTPSSLQSYNPPGSAWLMVPGVALFTDHRLSELPGSLGLYLGTLVGIFLLGRLCFGTGAASLAVVFYALSSTGLSLAGTVWPRGHPFFYVWMAYGTYMWVTRRNARYLILVLLAWFAGMYIHLELLPAIVMLPAVWALYRPPVAWRVVLLASVGGLILWLPYLRFEAGRGFIDLRSQLLLRELPVIEKYGWCDPRLEMVWHVGKPVHTALWGVELAQNVAASFTANFDGLLPGSGMLLLGTTFFGCVCLARGRDSRITRWSAARLRLWLAHRWPVVAAVCLFACAAGFNEWVLAHLASPDGMLEPVTLWTVRGVQAALAAGGVGLLARRWIQRSVAAHGLRFEPPAGDPWPLLLAVGAPWLVLLVLTKPGMQYRFVGLWSLEAILLAGVYASVKAGSGPGRLFRAGGGLLIFVLVALNAFTVGRLESWRHTGWAGEDAPIVQAADYLGDLFHAEGRTRAAIGYRLFASGMPLVAYPGADARGKIGAIFDAVLEHRAGILNTNRCIEGVSDRDEYRIIQLRPASAEESRYIDALAPGRLIPLRRFGDLEIDQVAR